MQIANDAMMPALIITPQEAQEGVNRARGCSQANRDGSRKQTFQHARDEQSRSRRYRNRHGGYT